MQSLRTAHHADVELATVLDRLVRGTFDTGADRLAAATHLADRMALRPVNLPPRDAGPGDQYAWWAGLTGDEQQRVITEHPDWIGNVDGIPSWARDEANRVRLPQLSRELVDELLALSTLRGGKRGNRVEEVLKKLRGLEAVRRVLQRPGRRQLIGLDASSRELHVVLGRGDVDTADTVTVLTKGFTSSVEQSLEPGDEEVGQLLARQDALDPDKEHAAVLWMAYDAPQVEGTLDDLLGSRSVLSDDLARAAAPVLAAHLNGIDASRGEDPHLANTGHSYGGLVAALAMQHSTGTDDLVVLGPPSLGTDDPARLDVPAGHIHVVEADGDLVADSGFFGPDPTFLEGVRQLESAARPELGLTGVTGHTSYLTDGSTSQHNLAAVGASLHDQAIESTRAPELSDRLRHTVQQGQDLLDEGREALEGLGRVARGLGGRFGLP